MATLDQAAHQDHGRRLATLRRAITDTDTKSRRLIRNLELTDDLDPDLIRDISQRRAELRA